MITTLLCAIGFPLTAFGGLWIAALFVPSAAMVLKSLLDFLRSPLGLIIAVVAAGFFLFTSGWVGGDIHGTSSTRSEWRAADALKEEAAKRLIEENRVKAAADADQRISVLDAYAKSLSQKVNQYESENTPRAACRLTADDVRRLRHIR